MEAFYLELQLALKVFGTFVRRRVVSWHGWKSLAHAGKRMRRVTFILDRLVRIVLHDPFLGLHMVTVTRRP